MSGGEARGEIGDGGEVRQIELFRKRSWHREICARMLSSASRPLASLRPVRTTDGAGACQRQRGLIAEAAGGAGNDGGLAASGAECLRWSSRSCLYLLDRLVADQSRTA